MREQMQNARKYAPLNGDHPLVTQRTECPACNKPFLEGDVTTLIVLGPGDDPEEQSKAFDGRPYNARAIPVHYDCAYGRNPLE